MPSASYRPLQPRQAKCRSCGAPVFWVSIPKTGKRMPLNAAPSDNGTLVLIDADNAVVLSQDELAATTDRRYVSHFATCPHSVAWRRARGIPEPAA